MSSEMLTELIPASTKDGSMRDNVIPFVVRPSVRMVGMEDSSRVRSSRSCRSKGSPPVRRTLSTPRDANSRVRRNSSDDVRCVGGGRDGGVVSGMQ